MSCVVAIKDNNNIYMAADSFLGSKYIYSRLSNDGSKLFKKDNFLYGVVGSARLIQIMKYNFKEPSHRIDESDEQYLYNTYMDSLIETMKGKEVLGTDKNIIYQESDIIIGYNGNIYLLSRDMQISKFKEEYIAIGAGNEIAIGSLYSTKDKDPETRVKLAIQAACYHNPYVCEPIIYECL